MQSEIMFAGFGGQVILLMEKILAHAAMKAYVKEEFRRKSKLIPLNMEAIRIGSQFNGKIVH